MLFLGVSLLAIAVAHAQSPTGVFKPFKVDIAFGAAVPQGTGSSAGVLIAIEPKYAVMDQVSVGLRMEAAITARGFSDNSGNSASGKVSVNASYLLTGDYYFTNEVFRPFAGAGVGLFSFASASFDNNTTTTVAGASKFGGMIRAGFEVAHFRLGVEYNLIGKTDAVVSTGGSSTTTVSSKNSYLGIKLGFFIGGGRH